MIVVEIAHGDSSRLNGCGVYLKGSESTLWGLALLSEVRRIKFCECFFMKFR